MRESSVVNEWVAEGKVEGRAETVRDVLEARFGALPTELVARLAEARAADILKKWTVLAACALTLEQFRNEAGI